MSSNETDLIFGGFNTLLDLDNSITGKQSVFRAAVHSQQEADKWLADYSRSTQSQWIVKETFPHYSRYELLTKTSVLKILLTHSCIYQKCTNLTTSLQT